jgi:iron complex outermembrane receptor protein
MNNINFCRIINNKYCVPFMAICLIPFGHVQAEDIKMDKMMVTATRVASPLGDIPASTTVISRESLIREMQTSDSLAAALGHLVPGLAFGRTTNSNYGQTLRGRDMLVLIDGVPQNTNRNVARNFSTIDHSAIDRVEIIRGSTAVYGNGAAGGIINFITRKPSSEKIAGSAEIGLTGINGHENGSRANLGVSSRTGKTSYRFDGTINQTGSFTDANGDRIPNEVSQGDFSDTRTINLFSSFAYTGADQEIQLSVNHYESEQDTTYMTDPIVLAQAAGSVNAQSRGGFELEDQPASKNLVTSLNYTRYDVLGSELQTQAYYRDYFTRFSPFDGRAYPNWGHIAQSELDSVTTGARATVNTPVLTGKHNNLALQWGLDYASEDSKGPVNLFDGDAYNNSLGLVYTKIGKETFVPPTITSSTGAFAQANWRINSQWLVRTGVRHEQIAVDVDTYTALGSAAEIEGAKLDYSATIYNIGSVFTATQNMDIFATFSQGFSLPDTGLVLRSAPEGFEISKGSLEALEVDNYELGFRGDWNHVQASISAFYNESDTGYQIREIGLSPSRNPERIQGLEGTLDYHVSQTLRVGATYSQSEGKQKTDGGWVALGANRITPVETTVYFSHATLPRWSNQVNIYTTADRDDAFDDGVDSFEVKGYTTLDYNSSILIGDGIVRVGIQNLLNKQYEDKYSQLENNTTRLSAQGRRLSLSYAHSF